MKKRTPSEWKQVRLRRVIALLGVVTLCLIAILIQLEQPETDEQPDASTLAPVADPSEQTVMSTSKDEPPVQRDEEIPPKEQGDIYLLVDDVGNNLSNLRRFLALDTQMTFAVMPQRPFTLDSIRMISEAGYPVILHQPMEAVGEEDPGPAALYADMSSDEVINLMTQNLNGLTGVVGLNNHMGSRVTADSSAMDALMAFLSNQGLFFVDSVTTEHSVASEAARRHGVPFARRTSAFLDNESNPDAVRKFLSQGVEAARLHGSSVLIGHVHSDTLLEVLTEDIQRIEREGYTFKPITEYPAFRR